MKKILVVIVSFLVITTVRINVNAEEINFKSKELTIQTWDDIDIIEERLNIFKNENPELTEEEIDKFLLKEMTSEEFSGVRTEPYSTYKQWYSLTAAEKKLAQSAPAYVIYVSNSRKFAESKTVLLFGYNGEDDNSDAFRHAIWNMHMVSTMGDTMAERWATAHESESYGLAKTMDLYNNNVGRQKSWQGLSESSIYNFARGTVSSGGLRRLNSSKTKLIPSSLGK